MTTLPLEPSLLSFLLLLLVQNGPFSLLRLGHPPLALWTLCSPCAPRSCRDAGVTMPRVNPSSAVHWDISVLLHASALLSVAGKINEVATKGHPSPWPSSTSPPSLAQAPPSPIFSIFSFAQIPSSAHRAPSPGQASRHPLSLQWNCLHCHICCHLLALLLPQLPFGLASAPAHGDNALTVSPTAAQQPPSGVTSLNSLQLTSPSIPFLSPQFPAPCDKAPPWSVPSTPGFFSSEAQGRLAHTRP